MLSSPKGAIVWHDEIDTLIQALTDAAEFNMAIIESETSPERMRTNKLMREHFKARSARVKRFLALKKQLERAKRKAA